MKRTNTCVGKMQNGVKAGGIYRIRYNWKCHIYINSPPGSGGRL